MVAIARVALVTGSSSGIGAATVRALAAPGMAIAVHARKNRAGAEKVAAVAREAVNEHGVIRIRMAVLCTASKEACDGLVEEFKPLNEEMRKRLQQNL